MMRHRVIWFALLLMSFTWSGCDNDYYYGNVDVYTISGGSGTSIIEGAVEIVVNPDGWYNPNQFYTVQLVGFRTVTLLPGAFQRVPYPLLIPGIYRVRLWSYCYDYFDPTCFDQYYDFTIDVFAGRTTRVNYYP